MKKSFFIAAVILFLYSCNDHIHITGSDSPDNSHYDVHVKIIPEDQFIEVNGSLAYLAMDDSLDQLSFHLHKELKINNFSVNGDPFYQLDTSYSNIRWLPDAIRIVYPLKKEGCKGDIYNVEFSYQGRITQWPKWSGNVIGPDWIEMGLYFPWYPSIGDLFTYNVSVEIDPEYKVFAIGKYTDNSGSQHFETEFPVNDFIICSAKELEVKEAIFRNQPFQIVNSTLSDPVADLIQSDIEGFYESYNDWFGETKTQNMSLVLSKREKGGGYSRIGGLFLGGLNDQKYLNNRLDYVRYLAHETAHFWWHGAEMNWEDWLNESFAEYSALLILRELHSNEVFNSRIAIKINESENTPAIWGMSRNDPHAQEVLYSKGVVLLNELEQKMGSDNFLELCRLRIANQINTTSDLLNLVNEIGGKEISNWLEQSLKSR